MKRFVIIALTVGGAKVARYLKKRLQEQECHADVVLSQRLAQDDENYYLKGEFTRTIHRLFKEYDCVICIMATGIVVRSLASVIVDKTVDPAVIVMDEKATNVISLLSGHVGGANEWTRLIAKLTGATPVITTATDTENVQALDILAKRVNGWYPNFKENTKKINCLLAEGKKVELYLEPYLRRYLKRLNGFEILSGIKEHQEGIPLIIVSDRSGFMKSNDVIHVIPQVNVLGIGCRKNVTYEMMQQTFAEFCTEHQLLWQSFAKLASIDVKKHEPAIQYLAQTFNITAEFYSASELRQVSTNYPASAFVLKTVGVGNVACAAADYASGEQNVTRRYANHEITMALSRLHEI
ncbi:cobalt-precorrin 5A hydrolase [Limosilactobacillus sp. STM2_1]|uniref:Cobalt-precorrin 5A hydrolase n=1 Tax=Limosilactobacillus rudii TaxID=2759755 RepID=A0A7W3UKU5_9LACO|nr:cobalt-precorrin 5A hydrolase [Limosilactobacillus rudii]MBB1079422.1 cobalt-precorrin 5A hydrolase [Limosilactobacillus rudii]MBB1097468.1 cobalt-precorrin 5A hydrolase [Limosilactobacillus rudii]MCD7134577.1 cobalt-precorrin 5A hydrolase [Limosilactobacillus rudii]